MPSPNFLICGPRSCAKADALIANPMNVANSAATLILMKLLPRNCRSVTPRPSLTRIPETSPVSANSAPADLAGKKPQSACAREHVAGDHFALPADAPTSNVGCAENG